MMDLMAEWQSEQLAPPMAKAIVELMTIIRECYPDAQFTVTPGIDELESIHLTATVDIDETDDVIDLVIDRLLELQVDEQLPIHVIPLRPIERVIAAMRPTIAHA
jgi:hypothetical protein